MCVCDWRAQKAVWRSNQFLIVLHGCLNEHFCLLLLVLCPLSLHANQNYPSVRTPVCLAKSSSMLKPRRMEAAVVQPPGFHTLSPLSWGTKSFAKSWSVVTEQMVKMFLHSTFRWVILNSKKCFLVKPCIVKPSVLVYTLFQVGEKKKDHYYSWITGVPLEFETVLQRPWVAYLLHVITREVFVFAAPGPSNYRIRNPTSWALLWGATS